MAGGRLVRLTAPLFVLMAAPVPMSAATSSAATAVVVAAPSAAAVQVALGAIDSCINRLNADTDIGYERIAARCPGLTRRLAESGWSAWLPRDWRQPGNDLSAGGLRALRDLLRAASATSLAQPPSVDSLPAVLATLTQPDTGYQCWWARAKAWLRDVLERRQDEEAGLSRLMGPNAMSEAVLELVSHLALAIVVVLAVFIVGNELRAAGLLRRLRKWLARGVAVPRSGAVATATWDDVQKVPLAQRPRLLLELVVARLADENRLPPPRGLTVHELVRVARLPDETDRERLTGLAWMSERVRFANEQIPDEAVAAVVEAGRLLLEPRAPHVRDRQRDPSCR